MYISHMCVWVYCMSPLMDELLFLPGSPLYFFFVSSPLNPVCLIIYYPLSPLYRNKIMGLKIVSEGKISDGPIQ